MNQFGERIKQLREQKNLLQRQISYQLDIDTPMLSKIERGERRAKKEQVLIFATVFSVKEDELLSLWLADQVYEIVKDEDVALKAIQVAEEEVKYQSKRKAK
jgi:transcriptional regulator with XRE-family HTH domain